MRPPSPSTIPPAAHFTEQPYETAGPAQPVTGPVPHAVSKAEALRAPLAFSPPDYLRQGAAVMPPQRFAARDAHVPRAQSPRGRESNSLDALHVMMAMFREQS